MWQKKFSAKDVTTEIQKITFLVKEALTD